MKILLNTIEPHISVLITNLKVRSKQNDMKYNSGSERIINNTLPS